MPDDEDKGFTFEFSLPDEAMDQDAAKEWLDDFGKRLAREDQLRVMVRGRYHEQLKEPQDRTAAGKGADGQDETENVPVVSIMVCPGKRPYAPKK